MKNNNKLTYLFLIFIAAALMILTSINFAKNTGNNFNTTTANPEIHEALDSLTSLMYTSYIKVIQEKEEGKEQEKKIDENIPVFSEEVYRERLNAISSNVNLPYHKYVKNFIDVYLVERRDQVNRMVGLSYYYFPIFEKALEEKGLPAELKNLAIIESALNPFATSPMGAAGLWQFMPATGKEQGLSINSFVDERRDPIRSSEAAAKFLKTLYGYYGDWLLVIAAYNCGPGNVNKAIRRAGGSKHIWNVYPHLPRETRGYVPAFIAANYVMEYYKEHGITPQYPHFMQFAIDTIHIDKPVSLAHLAEYVGMNPQELSFFNPSVAGDMIPASAEKKFALKLPVTKHGLFEQHKLAILDYVPEKNNQLLAMADEETREPVSKWVSCKVRRGDNLINIAKKYNCSVSEIKRWNGLRNSRIYAGQTLKVQVTT